MFYDSSNHFKDPPVVEEIRRALADFDFGDNVPVDQLRKAKMSSTLLNMLITGFHSDFDVFVKERRIQIHKSVVAIQHLKAIWSGPIVEKLRENRLRWYEYVLRAYATSIARTSLEMEVDGKRPKGQPKQLWLDTLHPDLKATNQHPDQAADRTK
ncbi:unnamed protein product [Caenorhabditis auriculariae]|uniref:Uncharacterized protein n=1 Tax=Caenorhabditis auriculariae TaxID=2777116 RepID=A0A8S1GRC5_9PELO|nr:unnamed protein product [Caenorhabditis auriculariae]